MGLKENACATDENEGRDAEEQNWIGIESRIRIRTLRTQLILELCFHVVAQDVVGALPDLLVAIVFVQVTSSESVLLGHFLRAPNHNLSSSGDHRSRVSLPQWNQPRGESRRISQQREEYGGPHCVRGLMELPRDDDVRGPTSSEAKILVCYLFIYLWPGLVFIYLFGEYQDSNNDEDRE